LEQRSGAPWNVTCHHGSTRTISGDVEMLADEPWRAAQVSSEGALHPLRDGKVSSIAVSIDEAGLF
jgi:hypothetical protein